MFKSPKPIPPSVGDKVVVYRHTATVKDLVQEPGDRTKIVLAWEGMKDSVVYLHDEHEVWHRHSNLN